MRKPTTTQADQLRAKIAAARPRARPSIDPARDVRVTELIRQHDALRARLTICAELAQAVRAPDDPLGDLSFQLAQLRAALVEHHAFEEPLLRPVLVAEDPRKVRQVERRIADHVQDHAGLLDRLSICDLSVLRTALALLDLHFEAEEQYLLPSIVLRHPGRRR